jgi:hypothetical protein
VLSNRIALFASLCLVLASAAAQAGRPRGIEILDTDSVSLLPYIEQENLYKLTYFRDATGAAMLLDASASSPLRVTPLGFTPPIGSNKGSYTATPEGTVWAAFASSFGVRVFDLGDVTKPGPLAPVEVDRLAMSAGVRPESVQMGIIAILIGLVVEPRPGLSVCFQGGCTRWGWDGAQFAPVWLHEEEGIFYF